MYVKRNDEEMAVDKVHFLTNSQIHNKDKDNIILVFLYAETPFLEQWLRIARRTNGEAKTRHNLRGK